MLIAVLAAFVCYLALPGEGQSAVRDPSEQMGFDSSCQHVIFQKTDRIVYPFKPPPASHLHDFYGTRAKYNARVADMRRKTTTCNRPADTAGMWITALINQDTGEPIPGDVFKAYWRTDVAPSELEPMPANLMMVAGNHAATAETPQSTDVVQWNCKDEVTEKVTGPWVEPTNCPTPNGKPRLKIVFPQCYDGRKDSPDHKAHTAYPVQTDGEYHCPASHPHAIPRVGFQISYPPDLDMDNVEFSSGGRFSGHGDYWHTWRLSGNNGFSALMERCMIREGIFCSIGDEPR